MSLTLTPDQWMVLLKICREYQGRYPNTPEGREAKRLVDRISALAIAISTNQSHDRTN